ncbi:MAG: YggS family pyridoxal phosphate-dependent enzyme [Marinilabiliales bacterium]
MSADKNIIELKKSIPGHIKLVAVSKTKTADEIMSVYNTGHKIFGENKVQELVKKYEILPKDIEWHMIGHLQSNKVKYIAPFISLIHSVDSLKLLSIINKEAIKNNRVINCLLQFHIAKEETKFGLSLEEAVEILESQEYNEMKNIKISGLMGMATFTENTEQIREEFKFLKNCFIKLKNKYFYDDNYFCELSMGMTNDYQIAIEEGSTILRLGTLIFGERNYNN